MAVAIPAQGGYAFWSTDFHIAPIADMLDVFDSLCTTSGLCMKIIEHSFSGACAKTFGGRRNTCAHGLRAISRENAFDLCPRPHALRRAFFQAYAGPSSPLQSVDAFVCNHPPALCELYMPFNKSLLVFASVNLELSRENPVRWAAWLASLRRIAADPRNVVAANNPYDVEYIRFYAGIQPVYVPSFCGYAARAGSYQPEWGRTILFARNHNNPHNLYKAIHHAATREARRRGGLGGGEAEGRRARAGGGDGGSVCASCPLASVARLRFTRTEDAYPGGFEYADLARHPAIVIVPYTKSVMSFFEVFLPAPVSSPAPPPWPCDTMVASR